MHLYFTTYTKGVWKEASKEKMWLQEEHYHHPLSKPCATCCHLLKPNQTSHFL